MIARKLRMNTASKSNIRRLVAYLTDDQKHNQRVLDVRMSNCEADAAAEWAALEMSATQKMNTRAQGDKTYHLVLSFREEPPAQVLKKIEDSVCAKLGFAEHQRVTVLHGDTDNLHMHIAINKIHPTKLTMHEPYYDHTALAKICTELEQRHGLQPDNHIPKTEARDSAAKSMEIAGDMESLTGWMQRECLNELKCCQSWVEVHRVLGKHGVLIKPRGNGFVIASGNLTVKASSVDRSLSKKSLEERLGAYEAPKEIHKAEKKYTKRPMQHATHGAIWEQYQKWREENDKKRAQALAEATQRVEAEASMDASTDDLQRALTKHVVKGAALKRLLYTMQRNERQRRQVRARLTSARKDIFQRHPNLTWRGWLQQEAMQGNAVALEAMRARRKDTPHGNMLKTPSPTHRVPPDAVKVTHRGTILFGDGCREAEAGLLIPQRAGTEGIRAGLRRSTERGSITTSGTKAFSDSVATEAANMKMPLTTFSDENVRKAIVHASNTEQKQAHPEQHTQMQR